MTKVQSFLLRSPNRGKCRKVSISRTQQNVRVSSDRVDHVCRQHGAPNHAPSPQYIKDDIKRLLSQILRQFFNSLKD